MKHVLSTPSPYKQLAVYLTVTEYSSYARGRNPTRKVSLNINYYIVPTTSASQYLYQSGEPSVRGLRRHR